MDRTTPCYYDILNISPQATDEDVKQAYRTMAKIYHPDHNPHNLSVSQQRFRMIVEAYNNLKTPEQRMRYDQIKTGSARKRADNDNKSTGASWLLQLAEIFRPHKKPHNNQA